MTDFDHDTRVYFPQKDIPYEMIKPHNKQAMDNHGGQTLTRLAQRGGLSRCEALAVLEDRQWKKIALKEADERLAHLVNVWNNSQKIH